MPNPMSNPSYGAGGIGAFPSQAQGSPSLPAQAFGNPMMNAMGAGSSPQTAIGLQNPAGRALPAQAIANAQGQPFQLGGKFNPMAQATPIMQAIAQHPEATGMPNGFPSQAMAPNAMPQGFMQNAAPQMNPQTLAFLQSLFARR